MAFQVDIEAPVEHVWTFIDDEANLRLWIPEVVRTTVDPDSLDGEDPIGARFVQTLRVAGRTFDVPGQIVHYARERRLAFHLGGRRNGARVACKVQPLGTGTRVDYRIDTIVDDFTVRVLTMLARPLMAIRLGRHMDNLKRLAEDSFAAHRGRAMAMGAAANGNRPRTAAVAAE